MMLKRSEGQEPHVEAPTPGDGALGVFFPKEVSLSIDKWRRVYLRQHGEISPHITVAYPPFVRLEEWPSVRPAIVECLGRFDFAFVWTSCLIPCVVTTASGVYTSNLSLDPQAPTHYTGRTSRQLVSEAIDQTASQLT